MRGAACPGGSRMHKNYAYIGADLLNSLAFGGFAAVLRKVGFVGGGAAGYLL